MRTKTSTNDLSGIVPDDVETEVKQAAEVSMGTEITEQVPPSP
jgi:nucleolar protein 58